MAKLKVIGGAPLKGNIEIISDELTVLACQAASLLATSGTVILDHVQATPKIIVTNKILQKIGVKLAYNRHQEVLKLDAGWHLTPVELTASEIQLMGTVLARCREVKLIKEPKIAQQISKLKQIFKKLGATITEDDTELTIKADHLEGQTFDASTWAVTTLINVLTVATLTQGITVLNGVPNLPVVGSIIELLNKMGAKVHRTDSSTVRIQGVGYLHGADLYVINDQLEAGFYLMLAAATGGDVVALGAYADYLQPVIKYLEAAGNTIITQRNGIRVIGTQIFLPTTPASDLMAIADERIQVGILAVQARQLGKTQFEFPKTLAKEILPWLSEQGQYQEDQKMTLAGPINSLSATLTYDDPKASLAGLALALTVKQNTWLDQAELIGELDKNLVDRLVSLGAQITIEF